MSLSHAASFWARFKSDDGGYIVPGQAPRHAPWALFTHLYYVSQNSCGYQVPFSDCLLMSDELRWTFALFYLTARISYFLPCRYWHWAWGQMFCSCMLFLVFIKISYLQIFHKQGIMAHTCNSGLKRLRQEDHELKKSLGYVARPYLRKEKKKNSFHSEPSIH